MLKSGVLPLFTSVLAAGISLAGCSGLSKLENNRHAQGGKRSTELFLGADALPYRGVSLAGAEFAPEQLPGTYGTAYTYPTHEEIDYFVGKGMTVFRLPFLWERVQPEAMQDFNATELARLDDLVNYATAKGVSTLIDPHNYARYYGQVIGAGVSNDTFADLWRRLAQHYAGNSKVIFGLMNEPHDLPTQQWANAAQAAINAIRATSATNLIFVPGNAWTGASSWTANFYGTSNAEAMLTINDPGDNYAFEVHQYLDSNYSGTSPDCVNQTIGSQAMAEFTGWLRAHGKRGFLGEFAGASNATCLAAVDDMLKYVESNSDIYLGWTWWAAGPWWGNYMFSIEPTQTQNEPLMTLLSGHLGGYVPAPQPAPAPTPAPMPQPAPMPAPAPTPQTQDGGLTSKLTITSDWNSGYCASLELGNNGQSSIDNWTVQLNLQNSRLTQSWSANVANSDSTYSFTPVSYNMSIAPQASVSFGFCADKTGDDASAVVVSAR